MVEGVDGLLRDKTRLHGVAPLAPAGVDTVVALTLEPDYREATHWTVRAMAKAVGLYVDPHTHAIILSVDEKSQIPALDRTRPGLPLKKGRGGTLTHDYKRDGDTTLFAALNVLDGLVIGRNVQRHRHREFIRFLNAIETELPQTRPST